MLGSFVSKRTYSLVSGRHSGPAACTLIGDLFGLGLLAKFAGDLATSTLHVEEVWGQSALGCVGIVRSPLALLLAVSLSLGEKTCRASSGVGASEEAGLGKDVGKVSVERSATAWSEDGIGMIDVCSGQVLDRCLEGGESDNDLSGMFSNLFRSAVLVNNSGYLGDAVCENAQGIVQ